MIYPKHLIDLETDCQKFLKTNNIKYKVKVYEKRIKDIPTLIVSNHFVRPILVRKSIFTTVDSIITSAIITTSIIKIYKRKVNWAVKGNLINKFLFFRIKSRTIQNKSVGNYNLIAINKNYPFGSGKELLNYLRKNMIVALYPEGKTNYLFKKPNENFNKILFYLASNLKNLQVIPISIFCQNNVYSVKFYKTVNINSKTQDYTPKVIKITDTIAQGLPRKLRSKYKSLVD